jgi:hypothetical protein
MGFLDRLGKIATGIGGALQASVGLVYDLARAPFVDDDELDGFVNVVYGRTVARGGQLFGNVLGPEEGLGAAIGGLPGAVRAPARAVINPALQGLEWTGRELIREPLTAGLTAMSLAQAGQGMDFGEGYRIAQKRSLGQAFALAILTEDITDEAEVAEAEGTDWYQALSGTMDATARLFLEPDVLISGGLSIARRAGAASKVTRTLAKVPGAAGLVEKGTFGRTIRTKADVEAALVHPALGTINNQIGVLRKEEGFDIAPLALPEVVPVDEVLRTRAADVQARLSGAEAPVAPAVTRITETVKPAAPGLPPLWHGASGAIPGSRLDETLQYDAQAGNLVGTGFYTTASEEVATTGYTKKGKKSRPPTDEPTVYGVEWKGDRPPNVLDLDQPITPEVAGHFRGLLNPEGFLARYLAEDDIAELQQMMDGGGSAIDVYRKLREAMADTGELTRVEADEIITDLNWGIRDELGVDAFTHKGGIYAGKGERPEHQVYVWLDPGKLKISERSKGPSQQVMQDYQDAVARHGALSDEAAEARKAVEAEEARFAADAKQRESRMRQEQEKADKAREQSVDRTAARIRDLAFHDHRDGAFISRVLAEADDLPLAWGALMGHRQSMDALYAVKPEIAGQISRLQGDQARIAVMKRQVGTLGPDQLPLELPDEIRAVEASQLNTEIDALYDTEARILHNEQANSMVRQIPRISGTSERRAAVVRSDFFQGQWGGKAGQMLAAPLRQAVNMRPRNMVDLHDAAGDAQVTRLLRKARLPVEEQDRLRGAYMAATDPTARNRVLEQAEAASIRALAERRGIDPTKAQELVERAAKGRRSAVSRIQSSRKYDGKGRSYIEDIGDDGVVSKIYVPLATTQEFNQFLIPDLDGIDKVLARHGDEISRVGAIGDATNELLEAYQRLWKPSVLMRVGWPIRVVGEEQLRIMSQIGALLTSGRAAVAAGRYGRDLGAEVISNATQAARRIPKSERVFRGVEVVGREEARTRRGLRLGTMNYRGAEIESSFGTNATFQAQYRAMNSARGSMDAVVKTADDLREGLRQEVTPEWISLEPTAAGHGEAWEHAVNHQIGQDPLWRQLLEGRTVDEARDWLDTAEGRAYRRRMPHWKDREDDWLEFMAQTADDYLPTDSLKALALEGKARADDLAKAVPDAAGRPLVHGALLADVTGRTRFAQALTKLRDNTMRVLGTIPTDVLSRQPYFDWHYTQEIRRLVDITIDQGADLTPDLVKTFEAKARNYALGESKKLLYDLADSSELAHTLRFISPFYSAWQEVLTRWTGITLDNPAFVARMHEVWRAPERMGIVTDEDGNTVHGDGTATSPLDEKVKPGKDRYINFRLLATDNTVGKALFNDFTKHVPGVKRLEHAKFNKDSFNTILQGVPGVGPVVQIPLNEIAKGRPELEESLKWALPFGASQSTLDMLLPATARRIKTKAGGEEDRMYSNQLMRIYWDAQVDYNLGKRAELPTYAEAKKKTDSFYNVRTVASFVSPAAPSFQSPYQPYIDAYRALKEKDPETADEIFLDTYGDEFFPLTQSLSKTMDGIPPTLEGAAARQKYVDLIEKHPDLGGLIIGAEGAGEFSSAVYQSQLAKPVRPGAADKQRQAFSFEEAQAKPNERLGWIEYSKAMDLIDAERMNRGLPNLQVKKARDLADLKRNVIDGLARKYPEWYTTFSVTDRAAWGRKLSGLREIAADDRLAGRSEIAGLRDYLQARDLVVDELARRKEAGGASTISAAKNTDLAGLWTQVTTRLTEDNPAFAAVYYRHLERDPLDIDTLAEEVV